MPYKDKQKRALCKKTYAAAYPERIAASQAAYQVTHRLENIRYKADKRNPRYEALNEIKLVQGCIDCGYRDNPVALDFDHVRGQKVMAVSHMARSSIPWERVLEEVAKCEIRCANCHRIKTVERRRETNV